MWCRRRRVCSQPARLLMLFAKAPLLTCSRYKTATTTPKEALSKPHQHIGKIKLWNPFDRRGVIVEEDTCQEYIIPNTRAFETVLPTLLRTLEGATATFDVAENPNAGDCVIIRSRTEPITSRSYDRKPPLDFLSMSTRSSETKPAVANVDSHKSHDMGKPSPIQYANRIIIDLNSIPSNQLARLSGPLVNEEPVPPTKNYKDMRSCRIFSKDVNEFLRLKHQLGSSEKAHEVMEQRIEEAQKDLPQREIIAEGVTGIVLVWSSIHRSGIVMEGISEIPENAPPVDLSNSTNISIIRNVYSFQSALPTSQCLLNRSVVFTKVAYTTHPSKTFAENIVVQGKLAHDASAASIEVATAAKKQQQQLEKRRRQLGTLYAEESVLEAAAAVSEKESGDAARSEGSSAAKGPQYGVLTRWSGGQGTIEGGDGRTYYVASAAVFAQLVEPSSHKIRGAVVWFSVDPNHPRDAAEVHILSTATSSMTDMKPLLERVPGSSSSSSNNNNHTNCSGDTSSSSSTQPNNEGNTVRGIEVEPVGVDWFEGTLVAWSVQEQQGIIHGQDGTRYVLKDADENVILYAQRKAFLKKGRKVKFTTFGSTGLLACNVVPLTTEADEEELREAELRPKEPTRTLDGNLDEALPSPTSTSYWISRIEKSGIDVSEVKKLQNRAISPEELDDDSHFLDTDDLLKKDRWWNDPQKNKKFPNSNVRYGDLQLIGPASMLNFAAKAQDPQRLQKMTDKYQSKLTEEQKKEAWRRAKEMAPRYEELVKKSKEHNEEPQFYFF